MSRSSNFRGPVSASTGRHDRFQNNGEFDKGMWSSMLDSVASGKKLLEKNIVVLGGTPDTQKEFLETLASDAPKRSQDRYKRKPVVANDFALGYTYQDVLDADHEDILARLSIYLLSEPSPSFAPLLKPVFTLQSIPETLLVILLDWNEPWHWVRQLRDWIVLLREITSSLENQSKEALEETMKEWQQRKRGVATYDTGSSSTGDESKVTLPLSQGEWDEPLGLPLCVVCQNADRVDTLEVEQSWKEEEFDYVLQFLRTILMKHGASLIYTSTSAPNSLPTLIHSTLGIHSLLKKQALKHNVIDRDKVLVPPNWDSWGKIRVLRDGFDVEETSSGWSIDIQPPPPSDLNSSADNNNQNPNTSSTSPTSAVVPAYEKTIPDPRNSKSTSASQPKIQISAPSTQSFLSNQLSTLDRPKAEEERQKPDVAKSPSRSSTPTTNTNISTSSHMNDQIGPVQVNMGGIQVDADDMLKKLRHQGKEREETDTAAAPQAATSTPDMKAQNEALHSFFANLSKRGSGRSPSGTPKREGSSTPKEGRKVSGKEEREKERE